VFIFVFQFKVKKLKKKNKQTFFFFFMIRYALPNKVVDAEVLKPKSEIVEEVYNLRSYKRVLQVCF